MPITVYPDVVLPNRVIEAGVRGKQIRRNDRTSVVSGQEDVNVIWTRTRREYEIGFIPMRREAWLDIETLHEITEGGAYGFLMEDPKDMRATSASGVMADLGDGTFQLYKRYLHTASNRYKDRKITRPQESGFQVYDAGGGLLTASVDPETGIATITGTPSYWVGKFYVPVHFQSDFIDWSMVIAGQNPDARFLAGPTVVLQEVKE